MTSTGRYWASARVQAVFPLAVGPSSSRAGGAVGEEGGGGGVLGEGVGGTCYGALKGAGRLGEADSNLQCVPAEWQDPALSGRASGYHVGRGRSGRFSGMSRLKIFSPLYSRVMRWSRHRHAPWYLGGLSFAESSFFPIPPDVMLAPMSLANPSRAWRLALITTLASVAGGVFGYLIGAFALDMIEPLIRDGRYWVKYLEAQAWFERWGFWAVFLAGFSPIPYKVFTIAAGAALMPLAPFVLASLIGRGARFFLVAGLMAYGGPKMEAALHRYVDRIGWATVVLVVLVVIGYQFMS